MNRERHFRFTLAPTIALILLTLLIVCAGALPAQAQTPLGTVAISVAPPGGTAAIATKFTVN